MSEVSTVTPATPAKLEILPSSAEWTEAIRAFNARLRKGGGGWRFYEDPTPLWLAPAPGASAWREYYVLVDVEAGLVRGGYGLKYEQFQLDGRVVQLGWLQGPVAESAVDKTLKGLGGMMIKDSLRRFPMQISWGKNSIAAPSAGDAPMLLKVVRAKRFLTGAPVVSRHPRLRTAAAIAGFTGVGKVAITLAQAALAATGSAARPYRATEEKEFGSWADEVWEGARNAYQLIALRDRPTLNRAMPSEGYPEAVPLKVEADGRVVGWAALRDRQLEGDELFGDLHAGSVIDALALPGYEATVAKAAAGQLGRRRVDIMGACFLHPRWIEAFRSAGFLVIPNRRNIGFTRALSDAADGGVASLLKSTHLALIDSDGPRLF